MRSSRLVALGLFVLGFQQYADAQYRCDCTTIVDSCNATVESKGSWLEVKADRPQCARVDFLADGQPFVSLVQGGENRQNWQPGTNSPRILVQSCQVCEASDSAPLARAPSPSPTNTDVEDRLRPLIASVPEYPTIGGGQPGHVDLEFTVTAAGTVQNAQVVASEPRGVFDATALAAVSRWRYREDAERAPMTLRERITFAPAQARTTNSGPRNQCIRPDAVYNYGEMVDVGLINACNVPLLLFGCGEGTGKNSGVWVCTESSERGAVLVPASDRRVGTALPQGEAHAYRYTDSFSLTRAPNSELWWLACPLDDAQCNAAARLWVRALAGQSATLDPQARSTLTVARSY